MMPASSGRALAVWLGRLLMAGGLVFVGIRLWEYREGVGALLMDRKLVVAVVPLLCLAYAASCLFLGTGWWLLTGGQRTMHWGQAWRLYGRTQIAKYLPGNVFHLASRHILAAKAGVPHATLLIAATAEAVLCLTAAGLMALPQYRPLANVLGRSVGAVPAIALVLAAGTLLAVLLAIASIAQPSRIQAALRLSVWRRVLLAQLGYLVFFAVSSALFMALLMLISADSLRPAEHWRIVFAAYSAAWAVGFVIPGAPAGVGVREAVLLSMLGREFGGAEVLSAVLMMRVVTTLGDVVYFLQATLVGRRDGSRQRSP